MPLFYDDMYDFIIFEKGEEIFYNGVANKALLIDSSDQIDYEDNKEIITNYPIKTGDLLQYQGSNWFVVGQINQHLGCITYRSKIQKAEQYFKIVIDEELYIIPAIFIPENQSIATSQYINIWSGNLKVLIQDNDISSNILVDAEFIKMGAEWKVVGWTTEKLGLRTLYCEKTSFDTVNDDIPNEIANKNELHIYSVSISNKVDSINVNDSYNLSIICKKDNVLDSNPTIAYESSNNSIATIDSTGKITGVSDGNALLTVIYNNRTTDTMQLAVKTVHSISISNSISGIKVGETYSLTAICETNGVVDGSPLITFLSSNDSVATVDSTGIVTTIGEGDAIISAQYFDKIINMSLSVQAIAYNVSLTNKAASMALNSTLQLILNCTQDGATDPTPIVTYLSSNASIISVSSSGLVTALSSGSATISVTYQGATDSMTTTVQHADSFTYTLEASVLPSNEVKMGQTKTYTAKKFNNSVEVIGAAFDFSIVPGTTTADKYIFAVLNDTQCTLKANSYIYYIDLVATDRAILNNNISLHIKLRGVI